MFTRKIILFHEIFILNSLLIIIKTKITVEAIFNSIDEHNLYCDDKLNFYGTSNLNVFTISENGNLNNINSQLKIKKNINTTPKNGYCPKNICYSTKSNNEKILIELNNPQNLFSLFNNSIAVYIQIKSGNFDDYENYSLMFGFCKNLISIDLSNFSFKKVKNLNGFFVHCYNLEKIKWPNNKINSLIEIPTQMFFNCLKLTSIDLSFFDFSKAKSMLYFFANCHNLEKIKFPNNILDIGDFSAMLFGCNKIISIDLSNFRFNNIYNMSYLFYNCEKLNTIIWPKEIYHSSYNYSTYLYMFSNCYSLTSIDLSNFYIHGINDLSYMFSNSKNLQYIKLKGYLDWERGKVSTYHCFMEIQL